MLTLVVVAVISLATVDWMLMLVALLLFPTLAIVNRLYTSRVEKPIGEVQQRVGEVSSVAHESFDGALVVKTLGRAPDEIERLDAAAARLQDARIGVGRIRGTFEPMIDAIPNLGIIVLLLIGSWQVSTGRLDTGQVVQAAALFSLLAFPMRVVGFFLQELPRSVVASARLGIVVEQRARGRRARPSTRPTSPTARCRSSCDDVSYRHGDDPPVLDRLDLDVPAGEVVALVGATGSGKSSLCELLPRLVDPDAGRCTSAASTSDDLDPDERPGRGRPGLPGDLPLRRQRRARTSPSARPSTTTPCGRPPPSPTPPTSSTACPRAGTPSSASGASPCRAVSASASPSPAPCCAGPGCWCSTTPPAAVDPRHRGGDPRRPARARSTPPPWSWPTASPPSSWPTGCAFLDEGRIVAEGSHQELLATVPAYGRLVRAYAEAAER